MTEKSESKESVENTQQFILNIPYLLAERVSKYAIEKDTTITGVVIEALDQFLRK